MPASNARKARRRNMGISKTSSKLYAFPEKKKHKEEGSTCRKCSEGKMLPTQWNRLICTVCTETIVI